MVAKQRFRSISVLLSHVVDMHVNQLSKPLLSMCRQYLGGRKGSSMLAKSNNQQTKKQHLPSNKKNIHIVDHINFIGWLNVARFSACVNSTMRNFMPCRARPAPYSSTCIRSGSQNVCSQSIFLSCLFVSASNNCIMMQKRCFCYYDD